MSRIVQYGFLLVLGFLLSNCKINGEDPSLIINVEDDFYINMFEDISGGEGVFHITVQSIQNQNCLNTIIDHDHYIDNDANLIVLSINNIVDPETCDPGESPAFISIPFEELKENNYEIQINLKDVITNRGNLLISSNNYYLAMNTEDGFEVVHKQLNKIPKKTIWGYVGYEEGSDKTEAQSVIKELEDIVIDINTVEGYDVGYFGYFSIVEDFSIIMSDEVEDNFHSTFVFHYENDYSEITDFITNACSSHPGLKFYLFNGDGETMICP